MVRLMLVLLVEVDSVVTGLALRSIFSMELWIDLFMCFLRFGYFVSCFAFLSVHVC